MEKKIRIYNKRISYFLKNSTRAKRMRIAVYHDGKVTVTIPKNLHKNIEVEKYILNKSKWIDSKLAFYSNLRKKEKIKPIKFNVNNKKKALGLIKERIKNFQTKCKFDFDQIRIKNQKTIWGSCSRRNNLSFNFKILLLKPKIRDYVIVHELSHCKIKNHSRKFWLQVEKVLPGYKDIKEGLNKYSLSLF